MISGITDVVDDIKAIKGLRKPKEKPGAPPVVPAVSGMRTAIPPTFRRGGRVKRTGIAKVHKGETVLTASQSALGAGATDKKAAKKAAKAVKKAAKKRK